MTALRYTLLADGPSDRCLLRIIDWVLGGIREIAVDGVASQFADFRELPKRAKTLGGRMLQAKSQFPCDILFVHRDAEREPMRHRLQEIATAIEEAQLQYCVPVVPVRMTEAWLLLEVKSIRRAADNPNGAVPLQLPRVIDLEAEPDPKETINQLLRAVSEKRGRRLDQFNQQQLLAWRRSRVAGLISDFSPLQNLPAFRTFRANTLRTVNDWLTSRLH